MCSVPMTSNRQTEKLRLFVTTYLNELGASLTYEGPLLRAELTAEQFAELEGRSLSPWGIYSNTNAQANSVIYLAFNTADANDLRAELIAPGSHRLQQMITSARHHGHLGRFTILSSEHTPPYDEQYYPYLLIHMKVSFAGRNRHEKLLPIGVNLSSGQLCPMLAKYCAEGELSPEVPTRVASRNITVADAFELAREYTIDQLRHEDDGWAREALLALAVEMRTLRSYYAQHKVQADQSHTLRLSEVNKRCRPRALARPVLCALVFVPPSIAAKDGCQRTHELQ